ncbi:hypothetical protein BV95_02422 [Sphingobium chlorophenolicum]|uniref:Uncharacterized protein n=1 Tax=Sphingobium chlorophenolicum TaxID=46429 RepID=A0A081RDJ7_SPHCR|nr:hypothetical protein BV95_02422 [Sphingobium chlorophenolicum]
MNEEHSLPRWQDNIRTAGQISTVQPETQPPRMEAAADYHLGFCIPTSHTAHVQPAEFRSEDVSHIQPDTIWRETSLGLRFLPSAPPRPVRTEKAPLVLQTLASVPDR